MQIRHIALTALTIATALLVASGAQAANSVVNVQLNDRATNPGDLSGMEVKADRQTVKAGAVVFRVANTSRVLVHEMLVVKVAGADTQLPYNPQENRVIENRITDLGEVSDLKPGGHGQLTLMLNPGTCRLICNQPGHYHGGMVTKVTVTP